MRIKVNINIKVGRLVKYFVISDFFLLAGWGLIDPVFSVFIIQRVVGGTLLTVGIAAAIYWILRSVLQIPIARQLDRVPGEHDDFMALVGGLLLIGLSAIAMCWVTTVWELYAIHAVHAVAFALYYASWPTIFSRHLDKDSIALDWSLDSAVSGIGAGVTGFLGGVIAGTLGFADAVRAVKARGRAMQLAVPAGQGAMAAVLALSAAQVAEACSEAAAETGLCVQAANLNSPNQTVISGAAAAVEKASALCKAKGARRTVLLPVSAPFHCALMQPAQEEVARVLAGLSLANPRIPVAANVTGGIVTTAEAAKDALIRQVTGTVRWVDCVQSLKAAGAELYIESGPGKVLCGLLKQIDPALKTLNVEDPESLEKTLAEITAA